MFHKIFLHKVVLTLLLATLLISITIPHRAFAQGTAMGKSVFLPLVYVGGSQQVFTSEYDQATTENIEAKVFAKNRNPMEALQPTAYATISWGFFLNIENGRTHAVYKLIADIYQTGRINPWRVERIEEAYTAGCESTGSVNIGYNAATFQGGYLRCRLEKANFLQFIASVLQAGGPYKLEGKDIHFSSYTNPWAAASVTLAGNPLQSTVGTLVDHPDVCLQISTSNTKRDYFPLALRVVADNHQTQDQYQGCEQRIDLLADDRDSLNWGLTLGANRFWVGESIGAFLSLWYAGQREIDQQGNWPTQLQPWFAFLPSPRYLQDLANTGRLFWRSHDTTNGASLHAAPATQQFGVPTDTDNLQVTVGCDMNGGNCVHMTLHTLLLDPTCMGG